MRRLALVIALAGCTNGTVPSGPDDAAVATDDAAHDASSGGGIMWIDAATGSGSSLPCEDNTPNSIDGRHNTGKSCFQSCHNHGFTAAGTLYTNATGNSPFAGATITLIDSNSSPHTILVAPNGNFYTKEAIAFPALTYASSCPSATKMQGSTPDGNCNAGNCHPGGTNAQLHLP
jgi:hypothetical protein